MRRQFHNVRTYVHDKVQDINHSSRALSSNVISSISALGRREDKDENRIFGVPLTQHLRNTEREISVVIESCVAFLLEFLEEEGLFRIPGSLAEVKRLKSGFETGLSDLTDRVRDPHAVAGTLKSYLRELPEPLLTHALYTQWIDASQISDPADRLQALRRVCEELPQDNFVNLRYLIKFLDKLVSFSDVNKMSSQNIAMAITPSLMWSPVVEGEEDATAVQMSATNLHSVVVYSLISHAQFFFPDDVHFTSLATFAMNEANRTGNRIASPDSGSLAVAQPQPKVTPRKTPKKPAPPIPGVIFRNSQDEADAICINNNNEKGVSVVTLRHTGCPVPSDKVSRLSNSSSHSSSEALCSSPPVAHEFDTTSLDRKAIIRRNSDKFAKARKALNRKSALSLQRPTVPPPERPGSALTVADSSLMRQRSVDDLLKGSPLSSSEMRRSTQVLSTKQESDSSGIQTVKAALTQNCAANDVADTDEPGYGMAHSWAPQSALFSSLTCQADEFVPASACSLKSFKRLDSPPPAGASQPVTQIADSSHSLHSNHKESNVPDSGRTSSPAPPIPPPPSAPKKPPRKAKSKSSHSHHPYSESSSPDQMTDPDKESAAILVQNHGEEGPGDGLEHIIHNLNQSIDLLDKSENGNGLNHKSHQSLPQEKPMRKSRSRDNLTDGETGDPHPGNEDCGPDMNVEAKTKPPKPAPPPKPRPKIAVPSSTSSYL